MLDEKIYYGAFPDLTTADEVNDFEGRQIAKNNR